MRRPVYVLAGGAALALALVLSQAAATRAQTRWEPPDPMNLKVLPQNISKRELVQTMRGFTAGLGVRCAFCHKGEEGKPLDTYDFMSDAKSEKVTARQMLRMVMAINDEYLKGITVEHEDAEAAEAKGARVTCYTCHRGQVHPVTTPPPREGRGPGR